MIEIHEDYFKRFYQKIIKDESLNNNMAKLVTRFTDDEENIYDDDCENSFSTGGKYSSVASAVVSDYGSGSDDDNDGESIEYASTPTVERDLPSIEELTKQLREITFDSDVYVVPPIVEVDLESRDFAPLIKNFKTIYSRWCGEDARKLDVLALPYYVFGLEMGEVFSEEVICKAYSKLFLELSSLNIAFQHTGVMEEKDPIVADYQRMFNRMYELLYNSKMQLVATMRNANCVDPKKCNTSPEKYDIFQFSALSSADLAPCEKLVMYIHKRCFDKKYRKVNEMLYAEHRVRNADGKEYGTYSWKPVMTIRNFIIRECDPRTNFDMWRNMMDRATLDRVAKYLAECNDDPQLPNLKQDRTISAWRTGLWFAEYAAFYPYTNGRLPDSICACVFIDQDFDNTDYGDDFMNIPCVVKKILGDQNFTREDQSFILGVALGRLIFEPGLYDNWEIIPFLWGLAQTGKSCLIDACSKLFDPRDVQGVGNNIEKQFGLANLVGKKLWVANDVKKNFGMDAGDLQTITSLELMSVAVKFKDAISIKWNVPGIIAGNEIPRSWTDTLRALERRILLIDFPNSVARDNQVKADLANERSAFYRIITHAYHYWQRKCGRFDIWQHAPKRFKESRRIITEHENPTEMYLNSSEVEITKNPKDYVRQGYLAVCLKAWCSNWGHKQRISPSDLALVLKNRGVKVDFCEKEWPLSQVPPTAATATAEMKAAVADTGLDWKPTTASDVFYFGIKINKKKNPPPSSSGGGGGQRPGSHAAYGMGGNNKIGGNFTEAASGKMNVGQ